MKQFEFGGYTLSVKMTKYAGNGRRAIQLIDTADGELYCMATVNMPDVDLSDSEVAIKNWSENEGILQCLQVNGVIGPVKRRMPSGFVYVDIVDLL
jgi:hypothetical protein